METKNETTPTNETPITETPVNENGVETQGLPDFDDADIIVSPDGDGK